MNRNELRNLATEYGISHPLRVGGQPAYADMGTLVSAGASIVGGMMSADASENASNAQLESNAQAIAEQRRQFDQIRSDNAPFRDTGVAANRRLAYLLGIGGGASGSGADQYSLDDFIDYNRRAAPSWYQSPGPQETDARIQYDRYKAGTGWTPEEMKTLGFRDLASASGGANDPLGEGFLLRRFADSDLNADPVYQSGLKFGLDEGTGAINSRAIAMGGYDSGATLKALTRFANDYGSTKANESYNRFTNDQNNIFNRLSGVSGSGQVATNAVNAAGTNMSNNVSGMMTDAGNARAAGIVGGANAWSGAMSGVNNAYNNWQSNETLKKILADRQNQGGWGNGF